MISTYGAITVYCDPFPGALVWCRLDLNVCFSNFITQDTKDMHSYFFPPPTGDLTLFDLHPSKALTKIHVAPNFRTATGSSQQTA